MNPAAEKMFGCVNNEMVGHKFTKLVPKSYVPEPGAQPVACAWDDIAQRTGSTTLAVGRTRKHDNFPDRNFAQRNGGRSSRSSTSRWCAM